MRATLKKLFLLDMLYAFIAAALAVMVPLYLVDIGVDVTGIALILSAIPLSFMLMRIIFSSLADEFGTKSVEVIESLATLFAIAIYAISKSAQAFAIAQFSEGVRDAGFWATARTDIVQTNGKAHMDRAFATLVGLRQLADGIGRVFIGFLIFYLSFQTSFTLLFALSLIMLVLILTINKNPFHWFTLDQLVIKRIFHKRSREFWEHSLAIGLQQVTPGVLMVFLLPLYIYTQLEFDPYETASFLAVFSLLTAAANLAAIRLNLGTGAILFIILLGVPALVLLPYAGDNTLIAISILAISSGSGNVLSERVVSMEVKRKKDISTETSVIYFPYMLGLFVFIALGGVVVSAFGYTAAFHFLALVSLVYLIVATQVFRKPKRHK